MLEGKAGGGAAGGDLDLAIDCAQVGVDGARANDQLLGDLQVG
jgi:hypothetical protein